MLHSPHRAEAPPIKIPYEFIDPITLDIPEFRAIFIDYIANNRFLSTVFRIFSCSLLRATTLETSNPLFGSLI